jgi:hypothetical protein
MRRRNTCSSLTAANLERLCQIHPDGMAAVWLYRLTSRTAEAVELRQNSPFAGVFTDAKRRVVLAA